jgi:hypothetical protein
MSRHLRLVRRITAGAGGWAGDGATWNGESSVPVPASAPAVEVGSPIFKMGIRDEEGQVPTGISGLMRVTGADATRRFDLRLVLAYTKVPPSGPNVIDWRETTGPTPPTPPAPRDIGDGEQFTTLPLVLPLQDMAFHLVPQGGNLLSGSVVELWAAEL